ncbi:hypothetical protein SEA_PAULODIABOLI_225 [Microbacterium phage PauloDiaboli]|nr:hypothetical protein SEA_PAULODIABOLI_225 [Microbacterium phage PauloDiaboli]
MTFDLDRAFRHMQMRVSMLIELRASAAMDRLDHMHAVGSGVCYCGSDMEPHGWDDTHAPREMMRDKSYGTDDTLPS